VSEGLAEERRGVGSKRERRQQDSEAMKAFLRHYETLLNQGIVSTEGKASS
jgi:hypothetical protein